MRTVTAAGCWPGRIRGRVVWLGAEPSGQAPGPVADRAEEVRRFRREVSRGLADLEAWSEGQPVLEGRLLLQGYRDALQEESWIRRVCLAVDQEGMPAAGAAVAAAEKVSAVMVQREALRERAGYLLTVARWIARRLRPLDLPEDAVLAAEQLSPLETLDRRHPALIAGPEPPVRGGGPLLWGVPGLGPHWHGRRVEADGLTITLEEEVEPEPEPAPAESGPPLWEWEGSSRLNGRPVCRLNGDPGILQGARKQWDQPPVVLVSRLDDLAAVPLFVRETGGVAVDLDKAAPGPRGHHPGVRRLLEEAIQAAGEAGVPVAVGGELVRRNLAEWLALGISGILNGPVPRKGAVSRTKGAGRGQGGRRQPERGNET